MSQQFTFPARTGNRWLDMAPTQGEIMSATSRGHRNGSLLLNSEKRIIEALAIKAMTKAELVKETGYRISTVESIIWPLRQKKVIESVGWSGKQSIYALRKTK